MIVDVHMHAHSEGVSDPAMFDPDRYLATRGGAERSIIIGMKFRLMGSNIPNDHVAEMAGRYPDKFAGFCCVDPYDRDAIADLERSVTTLGLIGLKLSPIYQGFYPHEPRFFPLYRKALDLGVPVAFHTSSQLQARAARTIHGDLRYIDEVALEFPDLRIIVCHLGYTHYRETINLVKKHPNVYTDCSKIANLAGMDHWITDRLGAKRSPIHHPYHHWVEPFLYNYSMPGDQDKILFASDFPGATAENTLSALEALPALCRGMGLPPIPLEPIHRVMHENWQRLFKINGAGNLVPLGW